MRLITLSDEYHPESDNTNDDNKANTNINLSESPELMSDYIQLIYSSIYASTLSGLFSTPSSIGYAQYYSKWQYSTFTQEDKNIYDLMIDLKTAKPKVSDIVRKSHCTLYLFR